MSFSDSSRFFPPIGASASCPVSPVGRMAVDSAATAAPPAYFKPSSSSSSSSSKHSSGADETRLSPLSTNSSPDQGSPRDGSEAISTPPLDDHPSPVKHAAKGLSLELNDSLFGPADDDTPLADQQSSQSAADKAADEALARRLHADLNAAERPRSKRGRPVSYAEDAGAQHDVMEGPSSAPAPSPARAEARRPRASALRASSRAVSATNEADDLDEDEAAQPKRPKKKRDEPVKKAAFETFTQDGIVYERQGQRCLTRRYAQYPKCSSCIGKIPQELCDFVDIRVLPHVVEEVGKKEELVLQTAADGKATLARLASQPFSYVQCDYPSRKDLFPPMDDDSLEKIKTTAATALLDHMRSECRQAKQPDTLWRRSAADERFRCANCYTSIFSASYICRVCGKEYCPECTNDLPEESLPDGLQVKEEEGVDAPPRPKASSSKQPAQILRCVYGNTHSQADLCPVTRLLDAELDDEVAKMKEVIKQEPFYPGQPGGASSAAAQASANEGGSNDVPPLETQDQHPRDYEVDRCFSPPQVDARVGSLPLAEFDKDIDEATFREVWAKGDPLVVRNCLDPERMQRLGQPAAWDPSAFIDGAYRDYPCVVEKCDNGQIQIVNVADFFATLGQPRKVKEKALGEGSWKLKDWPPQSGFDKEFPELYAHFNAALPVPNYTRRDGSMNISALYARNGMRPDLGPKMYTAWPSQQDRFCRGSTRLHMDVADAVNIMYWAAVAPGEEDPQVDSLPSYREGLAAWDIFPAKDADTLRDYLTSARVLDREVTGDPIHCQLHYLDTNDRQRLWRDYGVRSWRIYQKKGDAIFIPAGCAHQVCNLADCMKVAVDFVSPENVARCFKLTSEFRDVNRIKKAWKEDTLQLKKMLWHAWRACRVMQGHDYAATKPGLRLSGAGSAAEATTAIKLDHPQPIRDRVSKPRKADGENKEKNKKKKEPTQKDAGKKAAAASSPEPLGREKAAATVARALKAKQKRDAAAEPAEPPAEAEGWTASRARAIDDASRDDEQDDHTLDDSATTTPAPERAPSGRNPRRLASNRITYDFDDDMDLDTGASFETYYGADDDYEEPSSKDRSAKKQKAVASGSGGSAATNKQSSVASPSKSAASPSKKTPSRAAASPSTGLARSPARAVPSSSTATRSKRARSPSTNEEQQKQQQRPERQKRRLAVISDSDEDDDDDEDDASSASDGDEADDDAGQSSKGKSKARDTAASSSRRSRSRGPRQPLRAEGIFSALADFAAASSSASGSATAAMTFASSSSSSQPLPPLDTILASGSDVLAAFAGAIGGGDLSSSSSVSTTASRNQEALRRGLARFVTNQRDAYADLAELFSGFDAQAEATVEAATAVKTTAAAVEAGDMSAEEQLALQAKRIRELEEGNLKLRQTVQGYEAMSKALLDASRAAALGGSGGAGEQQGGGQAS